MNTDYEESGIPKERDGIRIARLLEAIAIYKGLWAAGPFSFDGDHYHIANLEGLPKPAQRPGPPILVGGGAPKVLGIAAREADIVGINPTLPKGYIDASAAADTTPSTVDKKLQWVRDAAGERFDQLELNILVFAATVGPNAGAARDQTAQLFSISAEDLDASPYVWVGEAAVVADQLRAARDRWGTSYFVVQGEGAMDQIAPVVAELEGS